MAKISFEEFAKIDIRTGKVIEAILVPGSKKLIKLQVNVGGEVKQCIAGLGETYSPQNLQSKAVVVVMNLQPRKIFGLESEVMLLAAAENRQISLLTPDKELSPGSTIS